MTEQRKWPDSWQWVDEEAATDAEAAAMVAKIEERLRKTEAAAKAAADPRGLVERGPTNDEIIAAEHEVAILAEELIKTGLRNDGNFLCVIEKRDKSDPHYRLCDAIERLEKLRFKPEPEVDEATRVTREVLAADAKEQSLYQMAEMYLKGDVDGNLSFQAARAAIAEALAVPPDVEDAARWIFDKSGDWPDLAKANAQKLAEYALRGKQ